MMRGTARGISPTAVVLLAAGLYGLLRVAAGTGEQAAVERASASVEILDMLPASYSGDCVCAGRRLSASVFPVLGLPMPLSCATEDDLKLLKGIGPVLAARIAAFKSRRRVSSIDELTAVKGVGPALAGVLKRSLVPSEDEVPLCRKR